MFLINKLCRIVFVPAILIICSVYSNSTAQAIDSMLAAYFPLDGEEYSNDLLDMNPSEYSNNVYGTITDSANHGFREADPDSLGHWGPGRKNNAIYFGGRKKYADISYNYVALNGLEQESWAFWIKTSTGASNGWHGIIANGLHFYIYLDQNNCIFQISTETGSNLDSLYTPMFPWVSGGWEDSTWHHFAAVYDSGAGLTVYKDGEIVATFPYIKGNLIPNYYPVLIGSAHPFWGFFKGWLDEIRVYTRALTQDDIKAIITSDTTGVGVQNILKINTIKTNSISRKGPYLVYNAQGVVVARVASYEGIRWKSGLMAPGVYYIKSLVDTKGQGNRIVVYK